MLRNTPFPTWAWPLAAVLLSAVCMAPTLQNGWVNWDDGAYVLRNPLVWDLSWAGIKTMFTTSEQVGLYHPLTLLSLAVDHAVWGKEAFGFHLSNLFFHLVNVLLVFVVTRHLSGKVAVAFVVALLFGMHPMHVESVAWVSARKDVLYTMFWLLSLWAYLGHLQVKGKHRSWLWGLALLAFAVALLAKAMAFSLPLIFLLVDRYLQRKWTWKLLLEKAPFFLLAGIALWLAKSGQQDSGSMLAMGDAPVYQTLFIGMRNLLFYGFQAVFPWDLSPFHPFPVQANVQLPVAYYLAALPMLAGAWLLWKAWLQWPKAFFGLVFFLVCIGPQLQVIPYGKAVAAERYTYVAYLGLFWLLAWGVEKLREEKMRSWQLPLAALLGGWLLFLGAQTFFQARIWKNGETLWSDAISDYPEHYFGYLNRGKFRLEMGQNEAALEDLEAAIGHNPQVAEAYCERGRVFQLTGQVEAAVRDFSRAVELDGGLARAYLNRGMLRFQQQNDLDAALADFDAAIAAEPGYALAHLNKGLLLRGRGKDGEAMGAYDEAVRLEPWNPVFYMYRGVYHEALGQLEQAQMDFASAHRRNPGSGESLFFRARVLKKMGQATAAKNEAEAAVRLGYKVPASFWEEL